MRTLRGLAISRSIDQLSTLAAGHAAKGFLTAVADTIEVLGPGSQPGLRFFDLEKRAFFPGGAALPTMPQDRSAEIRAAAKHHDEIVGTEAIASPRQHPTSSWSTRVTIFTTPACHAAALLSFSSSRARFGPYSVWIGSCFFDVRMNARPNLGMMNERGKMGRLKRTLIGGDQHCGFLGLSINGFINSVIHWREGHL
jgi:hypothetical protein